MSIEDIVKETKAFYCLECGVCTGSCPVSRVLPSFSPRMMVTEALLGLEAEVLKDSNPWQCLTCGRCSHRCPSKVDYQGFIRSVRIEAVGKGMEGVCSHGGVLQGIMRLQSQGLFKQNRLGWTSGVKIAEKGDYFYFVGCAPYFDVVFKHLNVNFGLTARNGVKLLNLMGIEPVVSNDERCCGHDLLWNGDRKSFESLAKFNVQLVAESGAKTLVTSCAECYRTWKIDYAPYFKGAGAAPRILHLSEFLAQQAEYAEHMDQLKPKAGTLRKVTFQDPCRLGRHMGVYDPPRELLSAVPGIEIVEMRHHRASATCCAGGTWTNCDRYAKQIQVGRLREARETGAEVLVTACPKCRIHFACAMKDPNLASEIVLPMKDLAEVLAEALV